MQKNCSDVVTYFWLALYFTTIVYRSKFSHFRYQQLSLALFRRQQFENQLLVNSWKVKWEDIEPLRSGKSKDGSTVCVAVQSVRNIAQCFVIV